MSPYRTAPPVMLRVGAERLRRVLDAISAVSVGMWPEVEALKIECSQALDPASACSAHVFVGNSSAVPENMVCISCGMLRGHV